MHVKTNLPIAPTTQAFEKNLQARTNSHISFKSLFNELGTGMGSQEFSIDASLAKIAKVQANLASSKVISSKDLLLYQIQISQLNMRVELLSKAADSAVALTRKLQNAQ